MAANVTFTPGQRVGNYEQLVELASGGTATVGIAVYRGAAGFERLVVLKRVHRRLTRDPELAAMLLDEARLASSVRHPNVVPVIDVVRQNDEVVLVMDYVESVSLSQLLRQARQAGKRLPLAVVSRIVSDTLAGLHEAHEAVDIRHRPLGIVHRDVSPQNVIVGVDGASRVIDFGIAKATSRAARTRAGVIKGKCAYMSPEQADGQPLDRRSDVFAAGIVLWEALTGARLFRGEDDFDELRRVATAPIPPPSSIAPECGPAVDALLAHALARPPADRFQTALAFARALEHAIPPAPPRVVAQHVEAICGAELEALRRRLLAILGDELEKLSPRSPRATPPPPTTPTAASSHLTTPPATRGATLRIEPRPQAPPPAPALPLTTLKSHDGADAPAPPGDREHGAGEHGDREPGDADRRASVLGLPRRSLMPVLLVVLLASLLVGAGGAAVWLARGP